MIPTDHKKLALALLSDAQLDSIIGDAGIPEPRRKEARWEQARRQHQAGDGPPPGDFPSEEVVFTITPDEPRDQLALDGRFIWGFGLDDEFSINETYGSRAEAVEAARQDRVKRPFQTARLEGVRERPSSPLTAENSIDIAMDTARGEWWESAVESFGERAGAHAAELDELLKLLWTMWCSKHNIEITGYHAEEIENHEGNP